MQLTTNTDSHARTHAHRSLFLEWNLKVWDPLPQGSLLPTPVDWLCAVGRQLSWVQA